MPRPATGSDEVATILLKAIECVNRAHQIVSARSSVTFSIVLTSTIAPSQISERG